MGDQSPVTVRATRLTRRRFINRAAALGVGAPLLGVAASTATAGATSSQATAGAKPSFEKVISAESADVRFFDPELRPTSTDATVLLNIYDGLTQFDLDFNVQPALATKWEMSGSDNRTWNFTLRQGVKFHNGDPFNADTVVAWIERLIDIPNLNLGQPSSYQHIEYVEKAEKIDDYTVAIHTKHPAPTLPRDLATYFLLIPDQEIFKKDGPKALMQKGIGTGPYKFVEWAKGSHISLTANEDYWGGKPAIPALEFRTIPEASDRVAALLTGEIQIADAISIASLKQIENSDDAEVRKVPLAAWIFWVQLNARDIKPLKDVRVRQAMNYAVDKKAIIDAVFQSNAVNSANIVTKECFGYSPVPIYEYDPDKAKQLLKEAGYADGFSVKFYYSPGHYVGDTEAVQAIASYLNDVGIKTSFVTNEWANFLDLNRDEKIDGISYGGKTILSVDADYMFSELQQGNIFGWMYPLQGKTEELWKQERQTIDPKKRAALCAEIEKQYRDQAGILFLWQPIGLFGVAKELTWQPPGDGYIRGFTMS